MTQTDQELKLKIAVAKMLPDKVTYDAQFNRFHWLGEPKLYNSVQFVKWPEIQETEWVEIVIMATMTLKQYEEFRYVDALAKEATYKTLFEMVNAGFIPRAKALCQVRDIIVI